MFVFGSILYIPLAVTQNKDIKGEKTHQHLLKDVSGFQKEVLHHAETKERVVLPDTTSKYTDI